MERGVSVGIKILARKLLVLPGTIRRKDGERKEKETEEVIFKHEIRTFERELRLMKWDIYNGVKRELILSLFKAKSERVTKGREEEQGICSSFV